MPDKPFNWRDYLTVSDGLETAKPLLEKALDNIAAAAPDGPELIRKAYENNPLHQKIEITPDQQAFGEDPSHPLMQGSHIDPLVMPGVLQLEPRDLHNTVIEESTHGNLASHLLHLSQPHATPVKKQLSVTGIVVHELFHLADFNTRRDVVEEHLAPKFIHGENLSREEKTKVMRAYLDTVIDLANANSEQMGDQAFLFQQITQRTGITPDRYHISGKTMGLYKPNMNEHEAEQFVETLYTEFSYKHDRVEMDATHYTDVFMAKHFPSEPWRGKYSNADDLTSKQDLYTIDKQPFIIPPLACGIYHDHTYEPREANLADLGTLKQPSISRMPSPACTVESKGR